MILCRASQMFLLFKSYSRGFVAISTFSQIIKEVILRVPEVNKFLFGRKYYAFLNSMQYILRVINFSIQKVIWEIFLKVCEYSFNWTHDFQ